MKASTKLVALSLLLNAFFVGGARCQSAAIVRTWGSYGGGPGQFSFANGAGIVVSGDNKVYVVDSGTERVEVFSATGAFLYQFGSYGHGPGQFNAMRGIAVDRQGYVYVVDTQNFPYHSRVEKFTAEGGYVTEWVTDPSATEPDNYLSGIKVDATGNVFVGDWANEHIKKFAPDGSLTLQWGTKGGVPLPPGQLWGIDDIALDPSGNVYVLDSGAGHVLEFSSGGTLLAEWGTFGSGGTGNGVFTSAVTITFDTAGQIYVGDGWGIQVLTGSGVFIDQWGYFGSGTRQYEPTAIAIGPDGLLYAVDFPHYRIVVFSRPSTPTHTESWGKLKAAYR